MSTAQTDEHGTYHCTATWIDTWGGLGHIPGWCRCEVREYAGGMLRVHRGEPRYLHDHPDDSFAWRVYTDARVQLYGLAAADDRRKGVTCP